MEQPKDFTSVLNHLGIEYANTKIPEGFGTYITAPPPQSVLIEIPDEEQFPLPEPDIPEAIEDEDLRSSFIAFQKKFIVENSNTNGNPYSTSFRGKDLDIPVEFDTYQAFITFKRQLETYYIEMSKEYGWKDPVTVCHHPTCLNSTVPTFSYCVNHMYEDENFDKQKFIGRCEKVDETPCGRICNAQFKVCNLHRVNKN